MENDILDFLPSYSNIHNFDLEFMNPYANFNESTFLKKEFNEEQISRIEIPTDEKLFKSQKFIMKFLSSYTPYDQLLIFFDMGVGKSRASISAIENILKNEKSSFEGALIFSRTQTDKAKALNSLVAFIALGVSWPDEKASPICFIVTTREDMTCVPSIVFAR